MYDNCFLFPASTWSSGSTQSLASESYLQRTSSIRWDWDIGIADSYIVVYYNRLISIGRIFAGLILLDWCYVKTHTKPLLSSFFSEPFPYYLYTMYTIHVKMVNIYNACKIVLFRKYYTSNYMNSKYIPSLKSVSFRTSHMTCSSPILMKTRPGSNR